MVLLAQFRHMGLFSPTYVLCIWLAACLAVVAGLGFTFFRTGRRPALAMAYLAVGCVGFLVLWILSRHNWSLLEIVASTGRMWIKTAMTVLIVGTPCSFAMLLILYHRQKDRPPKNIPPPPPQRADE